MVYSSSTSPKPNAEPSGDGRLSRERNGGVAESSKTRRARLRRMMSALDECLTAFQDGHQPADNYLADLPTLARSRAPQLRAAMDRLAVEECLAHHPELAKELEPLLETALAIQSSYGSTPAPDDLRAVESRIWRRLSKHRLGRGRRAA